MHLPREQAQVAEITGLADVAQGNGAFDELKTYSKAVVERTTPAVQKTAEELVKLGEQSYKLNIDLLKKAVETDAPPREAAAPKPVDVHTRAAEDRLKLLLGTRVRIVRKGTRGRIEIDFASEAELIRIYEQLTER